MVTPYLRAPSTWLTSCVLSMTPIANPLLSIDDGGGGDGSKCRWASELFVPACDEGQDGVEDRREGARGPAGRKPAFHYRTHATRGHVQHPGV